MADPSKTECAPGLRGNHLLSTVVELSKLVRSKSLAPTVLRCSDWFQSVAVSVPYSELVPAQAEAQNTKSNAIDAKWMRRGLIFSPPFPLLPGRINSHVRSTGPHTRARFPLVQISSSSLHASDLFSSLDMLHLQVGCAARRSQEPQRLSHPVLMNHPPSCALSGLGDCPNNRILSRALNRCLQVYTRPSLKWTVLICA